MRVAPQSNADAAAYVAQLLALAALDGETCCFRPELNRRMAEESDHIARHSPTTGYLS